ncbi:MAG TPA: valine--tRNA ligase [Patescibacteria group bacterium]|nr:valine--tRNA ligase [Patescibacteria group bacterium]
MIELDKAYEASKYEADIYKQWMDSGYFNPDNLPDQTGEPFTIILPPPNVTGTMHVGHALGVTIQDILIRYNRMKGRRALWLPGTDHAAIATQSKVEKILEKEGTRKNDLGRDAFLDRVNQFATESHDTIVSQMKDIGASLDWSREAYTLDDARSLAVRTAFKNMFDDDLIYRGHKVVNWDPKGQTVISDEEIVHEERDAVLYTFKYSADFPIPIATTRPETKVGDTAVAVHPEDERYAEFVGKEYDLEFAGVPLHIKIIADSAVEKDFGTGALGVTPAHSLIDAEMAERHGLPFKPVINEFAKMTVGGELLEGKKTTEARQVIVDWLREQNLIISEEPIKQNIATAERTGGVIEPLPKLQWFLAVNKTFNIKHSEIEGIEADQEVTLKQLMRHVVETNQINITPDHFSKTYYHWVDNLRDWCISRQIWFGHRIPVWYKGNIADPDEIYCGVDAPAGEGWTQDEDTLDTWFSSGLWTFSTLGWPEQTTDLKTFHPTSVLETGYDILFFWIARMILMTTYHVGQIPFKDVFLHGLVRDAKNRKMSKSLGNIIDPRDMIEKFGTDALRFALIFNTAAGTDMALAEDKIKGMKHFGNKLWNIARFILANIEPTIAEKVSSEQANGITPADMLILDQLTKTAANVESNIEGFRLHEAAQSLYDFIWKDFADVYIEASKLQLENADQKENTQVILLHTLIQILKLLHPFMPFVTEVLWQELVKANLVNEKLLLVAKWPQ